MNFFAQSVNFYAIIRVTFEKEGFDDEKSYRAREKRLKLFCIYGTWAVSKGKFLECFFGKNQRLFRPLVWLNALLLAQTHEQIQSVCVSICLFAL